MDETGQAVRCIGGISHGPAIEIDSEVLSGIPKRKWCTMCKRYLPVSMFSLDASRGSGLQAKCKECATAVTNRPGRKK
jgi:hypothetical protein